jgi:hypothetical protein
LRIYFPRKNFLKDSIKILTTHELLEIVVAKGTWRERILLKEVHFWPKTKSTSKIDGSQRKPPSVMFSLLMFRLLTAHYWALSSGYELQIILEPDFLVLKYVPL